MEYRLLSLLYPEKGVKYGLIKEEKEKDEKCKRL